MSPRALSLLSLLLFACAGDKSGGGGTTSDSGGDGADTTGGEGGQGGDGADGSADSGGTDGGADGGTDGGTDGGGDTGEPEPPAWTEGPALPDCSPQSGDGDLVALSGVLLLPDGPEAGLLVYSRESGLITCAGASCDSAGADVVCTEGVISPGLYDPHDHMQYNVTPPWQHDGLLFEDRYDWRSADEYDDYRQAYDEIKDDYVCEIQKWAELRVLVGGGTAAVGFYGDDCPRGLVRNLDQVEEAHGYSDYELWYSAGTVTDSLDEGDGEYQCGLLEDGDVGAVLNHVAEGINDSVADEIDHMREIGLDCPGSVFVHATDASVEQLAWMRVNGAGIVWSPRSNLDLYAQTTPADVALRMGVPLAIGQDWTWSGSVNPSRELTCAYEYLSARNAGVTDVRLWELVTSEAALITGTENVAGALVPGLVADIAVFDWSVEPYRQVVQAEPEDVRLVVIGGDALYGHESLARPLNANPDWCETVTACEEDRLICVQRGSSGRDAETYSGLESELQGALSGTSVLDGYEYTQVLHPLWECELTRADCDPREISDGDSDGDGRADETDGCPWSWNPEAGDHDRDGLEDACDPCPLTEASTCSHDPEDVDDDGIANEEDPCPTVASDGSDRDSDGTPDACDLCPDDYNDAGTSCPFTADMLNDESHPSHPPAGTEVSVSNLVVTGVKSGQGYFAQDAALTEYGGLFVYDRGDAAVSVGDLVQVTGTYEEYYGLTEITDPSTEVISSGETVTAIAVSDPCSIGTEGAMAEAYEAMLVEISDTTVSSSNPDAPDAYGEFEVGGCLRVDDLLWTDLPEEPAVGTGYSLVRGPLNYSFSNTKIEPRSADDLVLAD